MSCSSPAGLAIVGHLAARRGLTVEEVRRQLHETATAAGRGNSRPDWSTDVEPFLLHLRARAQADVDIPAERRAQLVAHYDTALGQRKVPSGAMWVAWQAFEARHERLDLLATARAQRRPAPRPVPAAPPPITDEQIVALGRVLHTHDVRAVLIGGVAGLLHRVPIERTLDADVCPAPDEENLRRLVNALSEINAVLRDSKTGQPITDVPVTTGLFGPNSNTVIFSTDLGPVDVCVRPDGVPRGYDDLADGQVIVEFHGQPIPVAGLPDIIRSKRAANRGKDRAALPYYEQRLHELDGD